MSLCNGVLGLIWIVCITIGTVFGVGALTELIKNGISLLTKGAGPVHPSVPWLSVEQAIAFPIALFLAGAVITVQYMPSRSAVQNQNVRGIGLKEKVREEEWKLH